MHNQCKKIQGFIVISFMALIALGTNAKAAERVAFVNGIFSRTVSIESIEKLVKTGEAEGILSNVFDLETENAEEISNLLKEEFELPLIVTSRLMNSTIGEKIIQRISKIIYPIKHRESSISIPAIRAATIQGLVSGKGKINILLFLKSYPNKTIAIDIPALFRVINKVESISELVKFFSNSPLRGLKEGSSKN